MGFLKNILPKGVYDKVIRPFIVNFIQSKGVRSYSQEGEDLLLLHYFKDKTDGFFIDIGAHHPKRFSNTYLLYKKGWSGINVEPNPDLFKYFNSRKRDINLNIGISAKQQDLTYYSFIEPAFNTFSENAAKRVVATKASSLKEKIVVNTIPLSDVFAKHTLNRVVDLLTVDVEGLDYEVLKSNDWNKYKPQLVVVENGMNDLQKLSTDEIASYLIKQGYIPFLKTNNNLFLKRNDS